MSHSDRSVNQELKICGKNKVRLTFQLNHLLSDNSLEMTHLTFFSLKYHEHHLYMSESSKFLNFRNLFESSNKLVVTLQI